MARKIAAIFAHPDDEVLACGGALAAHADAGDEVRIFIMATGATSRDGDHAQYIKTLRSQAERAAKVLGTAGVSFGDFPDNRMDSVALLDVVKAVEAFFAKFPADVIYTHHAGDMNIDHGVINRAVATACRPIPGSRPLEILTCEINSSTEWAVPPLAPFVPTDFIGIAKSLDRKAAALECYADELRSWPHPRSAEGVRALARWRGSQCGMEAAEAFASMRRVRPTP
jgi:LmbE family N-acetylglucosaminyl deacetylase